MVFLFSKNFWRSKSIFVLVIAAAAINVFNWIFLFIRTGWQTGHIPLHYNIYLGVDWFGSGIKIYYYPLLGLVIQILNIILSSFLFGRHKQVSYLLLVLSLLANALILLSVISLLFFQIYYF